MPGYSAPVLDAPPLVRYGPPEYVQAASPAAGANFTQEIALYWARLVSVFVRMVTDANVANRQVQLQYRDDANAIYYISAPPVTFPASETHDFSFSPWQGQADWTTTLPTVVPLAPMLLLPTHDFSIVVNNIQVGDQLSQIRFVWERFYPPGAEPESYEGVV